MPDSREHLDNHDQRAEKQSQQGSQQHVLAGRQDSKVASDGPDSGESSLAIDTSAPLLEPRLPTTPKTTADAPRAHSPLQLQLQTNIDPPSTSSTPRPERAVETPTIAYQPTSLADISSQFLTSPTAAHEMGSSLRSNLSASSLASSLSPGSASNLPSPYLAALTDLTPLPSPLVTSDAPAGWRKMQRPETPSRSIPEPLKGSPSAGRLPSQPNSPTSPTSPFRKKKPYGSLRQEVAILAHSSATGAGDSDDKDTPAQHTRNRSISDFVPDQLQNVRPRHVTISAGEGSTLVDNNEYQMHRERNLAEQRGLTAPSTTDNPQQVPTPPASTSSVAESDDADDERPYLEDGTASEFLEIHCGIHHKRRKFRQLRQLGQGTFSTVMLATREKIPAHPTPEIEAHLDVHKLVAIKIVQHGPAGGADEERIEVSLQREVAMLKRVSHPSLIHLKACEDQPTRSLLVLTYCPGGDLFDFASNRRDLLGPALVQRMFAELVSAVQYLHAAWIVHRDIKLENVLVNLPAAALRDLPDPRTHPYPLITLTDLGLSRRMPEPPQDIHLHTRCGSEDYAAPEILLGQPYDGRATDAWALGVLLYALTEGRLPFDAPPGRPDRSRNTHRIARCDWIWCRFGDEDGDWDPVRGREFEGARPCVEGLLKKARMGRKPLAEIADLPWVKEGICVPGGLKVREEDEDDML